MKSILVLIVFAVLVLAKTERQLNDYTFEQYMEEFKKHYIHAEKEFRQRIFEQNMKEIIAHNEDSTKSWKMGVNQFTDATSDELEAMRGLYVLPFDNQADFAQDRYDAELIKSLASENIDWREKGIITPVKNQAACGSCWAFAAAETIESYAALKTGKLEVLSEQQILDCTPNPQECGGKGGCYGGTVELAYAQLQTMAGISSEKEYPYQSGTGKAFPCRFNSTETNIKVRGYVTLPSNELDPLLYHIATKGPLAISVDASRWSRYSSGVFDGCDNKNPAINHAVQLVGIGTDPKDGDYWLIRNSWSSSWGENGYMRLKRYPRDAIPCAIDHHPENGNGCKGGPSSVEVCGNCGILYDNVYPLLV